MAFLEERFKIGIADADLVPANFDSINTIAAYVEHALAAAPVRRLIGTRRVRGGGMRVEHFLRNSAPAFRHKVALVAGEQSVSHLATSMRLGSPRRRAALTRGVARGDRVIVFMDNCWEAVVAIFAVMKAGAIFCPINPSTKADKLAWLLTIAGRRR